MGLCLFYISLLDEEVNSVLFLFILIGIKWFFLLCVNMGSFGGVCYCRLVNVEVINIECGGELF